MVGRTLDALGGATVIEFREVSYVLPDGRRLIDRISLRVEAGTTTALLGPSGSGKTTLLRMVNRMVEATEGVVLVDGRPVRDVDVIALRRGMGYVIQETGLFPHFTVERNVGVVPEVMGVAKSERVSRSRALLERVGLEPESFARRYPHQLSGGQRQRVGFARALAADPAILLMDEPFGALDPLIRAEMQEMVVGLLLDAEAQCKTVVLVTHDLDEAMYLADRIVLLEEGRVAANLTPEEFASSEIEAVVAYRGAFDGKRRKRKGLGA